jgi:hypothetical protein
VHFWRAASATAISLGSVFLFKRFQGAHSALPQFNDLLRDKAESFYQPQANVSSNASDFANGFRQKLDRQERHGFALICLCLICPPKSPQLKCYSATKVLPASG